MKKVLEARRNKPMFLIDIAVPRNIEPSVNELDNVFLYDIDDLQKVVDTNLAGRQGIGRRRRSHHPRGSGAHGGAAEDARSGAHHRRPARTARATCAPLKSLRMRGKFGALTPEQEQALEALTKSMINKIAHGPISELRRHASQPDGHHFITAIRKVFRLERLDMLTIGSRGSQLALWQAHWIQARLAEAWAGVAASRSSTPPATRSPTSRFRKSGPRACSPRKSRRRCSPARSTWRSTA